VRVSFTGPTEINGAQEAFVKSILCGVIASGADEFTTGAAPGVDALCAEFLFERAPKGTKHRIVVPAAPHDDEMVARMWALSLIAPPGRIEIVRMEPVEGDRAKQYRARNERMVAYSDRLEAFLWKPEFYRSGEWMTVNIARKRGVEVVEWVFPL
jgi:hypothetical protein